VPRKPGCIAHVEGTAVTKKKRTPAKKRDPSAISVKAIPGEDEAVGTARTAMRPTVQAGLTLKEFGKGFGDLDLTALVDELGAQVKVTTDGDLARSEAMLVTQAHTLDAIFNNLARRAALNMGEYVQTVELYMKLALRAQSQCRSTIEALSEMKNPRNVAFVKQANIAENMQINHGARVGENENKPNELLEKTDGERLDFGTQGEAIADDATVATVGTLDRAANTRRKSRGKS
jgi:hypothetical protein